MKIISKIESEEINSVLVTVQVSKKVRAEVVYKKDSNNIFVAAYTDNNSDLIDNPNTDDNTVVDFVKSQI